MIWAEMSYNVNSFASPYEDEVNNKAKLQQDLAEFDYEENEEEEDWMTYKEFIDNIIGTRGRHGCGEEYHEKHHIVPRCLGGEDK